LCYGEAEQQSVAADCAREYQANLRNGTLAHPMNELTTRATT
jgi:hypothetical protein